MKQLLFTLALILPLFVIGQNVGINTTTPDRLLTVIGSIGQGVKIQRLGGNAILEAWANGDRVFLGSMTNHPLHLLTDGSTRIFINGAGNIGIGNENATEKLDVNGNIKLSRVASGTNTVNLAQNGDGVIVAASSDRRLKENISTIQDALNKIRKINGVNYTWKADSTHSLDMGLIAQEVLDIAPEVVYTTPDGFYGINYQNLSGLLVQAIKEQQIIIDSQSQKILEMESKLFKLISANSEIVKLVHEFKSLILASK